MTTEIRSFYSRIRVRARAGALRFSGRVALFLIFVAGIATWTAVFYWWTESVWWTVAIWAVNALFAVLIKSGMRRGW